MSKPNIIVFLSLVLLSATLFCSSDGRSATVQGWRVVESGSKKTGCTMYGPQISGTTFGVIVNRTAKWGLILINKGWKFDDSEKIEFEISIDGFSMGRGTAKVAGKIALVMSVKAKSFTALQRGHHLRIKTTHATHNIPLRGSLSAMNSLLRCVKQLPKAPQKENFSAPLNSQQLYDSAKTERKMKEFFEHAKIKDYKVLPPKDDKSGSRFRLPDGTIGVFSMAKNVSISTFEQLVAKVISLDAKACKKSYRTGKENLPTTDGSLALKIVSECRSEEMGLISESLFLRRIDGGFLGILQKSITIDGASGNFTGTDQSKSIIEAAINFPGR